MKVGISVPFKMPNLQNLVGHIHSHFILTAKGKFHAYFEVWAKRIQIWTVLQAI